MAATAEGRRVCGRDSTSLRYSITLRDHGIRTSAHGGLNKTGHDGPGVVLPAPGNGDRAPRRRYRREILNHEMCRSRKGDAAERNSSSPATTGNSANGSGAERRDPPLELELKLNAASGGGHYEAIALPRYKSRPPDRDYPFPPRPTGVVPLSDHRLAVATVQASRRRARREGFGLNSPHIERTRILAFMIPIDSLDWQAEYDQLRNEVQAYSPELALKPHCVVFTKLDLLGEDYVPPIEAPQAFGMWSISAAGRVGLDVLLAGWWKSLLGLKKSETPSAHESILP